MLAIGQTGLMNEEEQPQLFVEQSYQETSLEIKVGSKPEPKERSLTATLTTDI